MQDKPKLKLTNGYMWKKEEKEKIVEISNVMYHRYQK